jgi:hypothetical protein
VSLSEKFLQLGLSIELTEQAETARTARSTQVCTSNGVRDCRRSKKNLPLCFDVPLGKLRQGFGKGRARSAATDRRKEVRDQRELER